MTVKSFLQDHVLIFDGAMGTYYAKTNERKCELASLEDPRSNLTDSSRIYRSWLSSTQN